MSETIASELTKQVAEKLIDSGPKNGKNGSVRDIYTAIFKEGPIQREYRFYAPPEDFSIADPEKRRRDREARIWRLCDRYARYLRSKENRKLVFVGVPQPFVIDLEAKMSEFESKLG